MALIIKKGKSFKEMDRKTAYTWGACALVFIFVVVSLFSVLGGDNGNPDEFDGLRGRGYDLAALPFVNDAAEQELLARYADIDAMPAMSTLYSPEEKEARQLEDEIEGEPEPADEEYASYYDSQTSYTPTPQPSYSRNYTPTQIGSLQSGSMASGRVGSRGTTWAPANTGNRNQSSSGSTSASRAAVEKLQKSNTGRGLLGAYASTNTGSKKGNEGALEGAIKGFQGGKTKAEMDTELEGALAELDLTGAEGLAGANASDAPTLDDVKKEVDAAKRDKAAKEQDDKNCTSFWDCMWKTGLEGARDALIDAGKQWVTGALTSNMTKCQQGGGDYFACKEHFNKIQEQKNAEKYVKNNKERLAVQSTQSALDKMQSLVKQQQPLGQTPTVTYNNNVKLSGYTSNNTKSTGK